MKEEEFHFLMSSFTNKIKEYGKQYQQSTNDANNEMGEISNILEAIMAESDGSEEQIGVNMKQSNLVREILNQFISKFQTNFSNAEEE